MENNTYIEEKIRRISQSLLGLTPLPTIIARIIGMIDDPRTTARDLGRLISTDQVLTTKVLKLANSAYYGMPKKIGTVELAVVILGFDALKDVALSVSLLNRFSSISNNENFDMSRFWEHSIACGIVSRMLAKKYAPKFKGEAFVAGLLHDIGKLIIIEYLKEEFKEIIGLVREKKIPFYQAEKMVLNVNHAEIGSWLAEKSNLPVTLIESIACHHNPAEAESNSTLPVIVYFSNYLVKRFKYGFSGDITLKINQDLLAPLKLKRNPEGKIDLKYYSEKISHEISTSETFISIIQDKAEYSAAKKERLSYIQ